MIPPNRRSQNEILHGKHLAATDPELLWNWGTPAGKIRARRRGFLLSEAARLKCGMKVMEIGCGTGLFTEMMAVSGAKILAVDISPDLLEIARQRNLPPECVEFQEMRFEDGQVDGPFDAIVGSSVLHHLDMIPALHRMYELLKPGGVIAFAEPNMLNPQIWMERNIPYVRKRSHVSPDETAFVRWKLSKALSRMGFVDICIQNIDWLHPATPPLLIDTVYHLGLLLERLPVIREFSGSLLIRAVRPVPSE